MNQIIESAALAKNSIFNLIPRIPFQKDRVFGLLLFLFSFLPLIFITVIDEGFETPKMTLFLIVFGVIVTYIWFKRVSLYHLPKYIQLVFLVFAGSVIVSTIFSLDFRNSLFGLMGRPTGSAIFLLSWVLIIYVLISNLTKAKLLALARAVVLTGLLIAVYSVLQQEGIGYYDGINGGLRSLAPSFLGNPNFNSMYLAMVIPVALYFFNISKRLPQLGYYTFSILIMIWATAQTVSRAGILAMLVSLAVIVIVLGLRRKFNRLFFASLAAVFIASVMSYFALNTYRPDSIAQSVQFQEINLQSRLVVWDMALDVMERRPVVGTGLSNFFIEFNKFGWSPFSYGERFDDTHNIFLQLGVGGGIPLVATLSILLGIVYYLGWKQSREDELSVVWLSVITAFIFAGSLGPVVIACWLVLALAVAAVLVKTSGAAITLPTNFRFLTVIVGPLLITMGLVLISTYIFLHFSKQAYERGDYQESLKFAKLGQFWEAANSRVSYYHLRSMLKLQFPTQETEAELLKGVARKPNAAATYVSGAQIYYQLWKQSGDSQYLSKMDEMVAEAIKREPNYANSYAKFAYLYFSAGNLEKALELQRLSLSYSRNQFFSWVLLSKIYYDLNRRDQFLYAYEVASAKNQESFLIKGTLRAFRDAPDIQSIPFPVFFPEPE